MKHFLHAFSPPEKFSVIIDHVEILTEPQAQVKFSTKKYTEINVVVKKLNFHKVFNAKIALSSLIFRLICSRIAFMISCLEIILGSGRQ